MLINLPTNELFYVKHTREEHPLQSDFPMHAHGHFELLIFLSGDITYLVEGNSYTPRPWDVLVFGIAETHKVAVHSDTPYERVVIQADSGMFSELFPKEVLFAPFREHPLGHNNLFRPRDFTDNFWQSCVRRLIEAAPEDRIASMSLILQILNELRMAFSKRQNEQGEASAASRIVHYINEHITEPLSTREMAKQFFISRTALYTLFREATGSGIHDYINVKRLIMAQALLRRGEKPTEVSGRCGFRDYTTFFRAYKKLFGASPKDALASFDPINRTRESK